MSNTIILTALAGVIAYGGYKLFQGQKSNLDFLKPPPIANIEPNVLPPPQHGGVFRNTPIEPALPTPVEIPRINPGDVQTPGNNRRVGSRF